MYTGIIQACIPIVTVKKSLGLISFSICFPVELLVGLKTGASVSVDGVCLTVVKILENEVFFDVMQETLLRTTLDKLILGQRVNIERSSLSGSEVGGHIISGHVHDIASIIHVEESENNHVVTF